MANYITVSALNNYLKRKFEADVHLDHVFLKGEISNCKLHSRGHLYFSLKDETSVINAIMFATNASSLNFEPKEGTKVFAEGKVTVYEASGKYQIIITKMQPDGIGELFIAYEKLKKELEKEGLFAKEHKRTLPKYPRKIGIITAPTGAAIRDILSTIKRRYPICETILFPALVQGETARFSIVDNINKAQEYDLDLLIVGRGGGSIEDLWAFNEECVARAIYSSKVPVISAVGHEVDFTIADFVADLRAPTPTGAAEMAVPNMSDVFNLIENYKIRLRENVNNKILLCSRQLESVKNSYVLKNPLSIYEVKEQKLSSIIDKLSDFMNVKIELYKNKLNSLTSAYVLKNPLAFYEKDKSKIENFTERLNLSVLANIDKYKNQLSHVIKNKVLISPDSILTTKYRDYELLLNKLDLLNPLAVLKKGYSVTTINNKAIHSSAEVKKGDSIEIILELGKINAEVTDIKEN